MKKIIILPLVLVSMLALGGCTSYETSTLEEEDSVVANSTSEGNSEVSESTSEQNSEIDNFTLVEDSEKAEATFTEAQSKNSELADVSGYEGIFAVAGTRTDESGDDINFSSTLTERTGYEDSHFASDLVITSSFGTYTDSVRFNTTENIYCEYSYLNYTYESDSEAQITFDGKMYEVNDNYSIDTIWDDARISEEIYELHFLESTDYSEVSAVYTNPDGYCKFELADEDETTIAICDSDGVVIEMYYIMETLTGDEKIEYTANLATVNEAEYTKVDSDYSDEFETNVKNFMVSSLGTIY